MTPPPKKGEGTCMFINNTLGFSDNAYAHFSVPTIDLEAQWVTIAQKTIVTMSNIETTSEEIIEISKDIAINKASCVKDVSSEIL